MIKSSQAGILTRKLYSKVLKTRLHEDSRETRNPNIYPASPKGFAAASRPRDIRPSIIGRKSAKVSNVTRFLPDVKFVPTGGINIDSLKNYLDLPNVIACGGSWIVNKDLVSSRKFEDIKILIKNALKLIKSD